LKDEPKIAILLMAAGSASRMKTIKQLLPWKGSNLLQHTLKTLQKVQKEHLYVVLGANYELISKEIDFVSIPVTTIQNKHWKKGLGNSISRGVAHILDKNEDYEGILVCLADQPLLDSTYYRQLIREFKLHNNPIVATKYGKKAGVPAIFRRNVLPELRLLDSDNGAKNILARDKKAIHIFDAGSKIVDIDTPDVYQKLYEQYN